jgi:hypothetical protein
VLAAPSVVLRLGSLVASCVVQLIRIFDLGNVCLGPVLLGERIRRRWGSVFTTLAAGVWRPELRKVTTERIALRIHDLRGGFVTIALANGRAESWVADGTRHRSSQMRARHKRAARTAAELRLSDWTQLDAALGLDPKLVKPPVR